MGGWVEERRRELGRNGESERQIKIEKSTKREDKEDGVKAGLSQIFIQF